MSTKPPTPEDIKAILQKACDRSWEDENLYQTAVIAANAIYWRGREIANLKEDKKRLIEVVRLYLHRESQPTVDIVATDLLAELENRSSKEQA